MTTLDTTEQRRRAAWARQYCLPFYCEAQQAFNQYLQYAPERELLERLFSGKDVVELGCGADGGLVKKVTELGARSYTGIDIQEWAIKRSREDHPHATFIHDDPCYVLPRLASNPNRLVVSTGLFDTCILKDPLYTGFLVEAIARATANGGATYHTMVMDDIDDFGPLFSSKGFVLDENPDGPRYIFRKR
jgi:predicted TPR repeat methyltransferase